MTLHYVYVDSRNRNPNENVNDFQVMLHNPIKNVVKAGLVSFSKGNNSYNVHRGNNVVKWREVFYNGDFNNQKQNFFSITLTPGYYGINELLTEITTKMSAAVNRQVGQEVATTYTYSIDDDYRISIIAQGANTVASNRWWAFYEPDDFKTFNNSIVHSILNLQREDVTSTTEVRVNYNQDPKDTAFRQSRSSLSAFQRTMKSRFSYTENQSTIHLASDTLAQNTQRMVIRNGATDTMKSNIMETIQVLVNRWSYIHLNKNQTDVQYHNLHNVNINHFDVKLLGEHYEKLHEDSESNFKAVFVFETLDEPHQEIKEMYREYNADAYRMAHRVQ